MRRTAHVILALSAMLALAPIARIGGADAPSPEQEFAAKLTDLDQARPMGYFELAEEIADSGGPSDLALARRLYTLSWETARRTLSDDQASRIGASVCIALADLSSAEDERRWLFALSRSVGGSPRDETSAAPGRDEHEGLVIAEILGNYRAGEVLRARASLDGAGRRERLMRLDDALEGRAEVIIHAVETASPCAECRNRRAVKVVGESGQLWRLCSTCRGNPGPSLARKDLLLSLRAEALALEAAPTGWSQALLIDPSPVRELDLSEIARRLRIDPEASLWRDGVWRGSGG